MRATRRRPWELRKLPYSEYLESPEWQETRRRKVNLCDYRCQRCGRRDGLHGQVMLNVHHVNYEHVGEESLDEDLECLCRACHAAEHGRGEPPPPPVAPPWAPFIGVDWDDSELDDMDTDDCDVDDTSNYPDWLVRG